MTTLTLPQFTDTDLLSALTTGLLPDALGSSLSLDAVSYGDLSGTYPASTIAILAGRYPNVAAHTVQVEPIPAALNGHSGLLSPEARFAINCEIIRQKRPEILADLQRFPLTNLQLGPLACGETGGQVYDVTQQTYVPLCHPDHPMAAAEADAQQIYSRDIKVYTLIGIGLGYFAIALAKRLRPWQRLLILDLDPCMFKAALYAVDVAALFPEDGRRVDIFVGDQITAQAVEPWFLSLDSRDKLHLSLPLRTGYTGVYRKAEYDALYDKCMSMLVFHAVGLSTWRQFGACIGDNDLLNLPEYFQSPGFEHLKDLWQGKPAVCVAAGPSLHKNLRLLCQPGVREKICLIAVGTVYALLQGMGLTPDIVTTIDFQRLNWTDQFQYVPLDPSCALVYLHSTYPQTPRRWPGPRFVAENASDTVNIFRPFGEGKKSAAMVQTVAHLNLLVAFELGASPIILLGQDLSMPPDQHHAAGARAQDQAPNEVPADAFIDTVDFQGQPVKSRHSFMSMKTVFERLIAEHKEATVLNCSEQGLALAGAQNMPLAEVIPQILAAPRTMAHVMGIRPVIRDAWKDYAPQISDELVPTITTMQQEVADLETMAHEVTAYAKEMGYGTASTQAWITQHEPIIQQRPRAWGLFAIRDFRILELMAAIPPEDALSPDPLKRDAVTCQRMLQLAGYILESAWKVKRLLRLTTRRLETMNLKQRTDRLLAMQHYPLALMRTGEEAFCPSMQWYAKYLYHTQQYGSALAVMRTWQLFPQRIARIEKHLATYRQSTLEALPAYFTPSS